MIRPWRRLSSRFLVADRWMKLRADTCETDDGVKVDPYYVIESKDWVAVVAVTEDDDLILVKQWRQATETVTLELPGGEVEPSEDMVAAARRELAEETGYGGGDGRLLRTLSPNTTRYANQMGVIVMTGVFSVPGRRDTSSERTEIALWPMAKVGELFEHSDFSNSPQVAVLACGLVALGRLKLG